MSQFFDLASMVLVPSGYRDGKLYSQKPLSSSGELTFSRGSDIEATRVAANGYIEKAKVNLLLQSNQFDTTWTTIDSSVTSGQSGYDGSSDAWLLENTAAGGRVQEANSQSGVQTYSVYAKAGTLDFVRLRASTAGTNVDAYFNLSSGTYAGSSIGSIIDANIESVGGGWHRCSLTYNETNTDLRIYPAIAYNDLTATSGNIYIQDAQLNYGLVAQEYQETTTTTVITGITNDLPRLDYSGGASCPSLLLEPSRQNLVPISDSYPQNALQASLTYNYGTSPEGVQNSLKATKSGTNANDRFYPIDTYNATVSNGTTYTISAFIKNIDVANGGITTISCRVSGGTLFRLGFEWNGSSLSIAATQASGTRSNEFIESYGNDWHRVGFSFVADGTSANYEIDIDRDNGSDTTSIESYGWQLEAGSYPTSYIPTYGTSATRTADEAEKTGISSLIGQTAGTLYFEFNGGANDSADYGISLSDGTTNNRIIIYRSSTNTLITNIRTASTSVAQISTSTLTADATHKVAVGYANNDVVFYVNGVQIGTDTSAAIPATDRLLFDNGGGSGAQFYRPLNQLLLFKTRLSNADLATLTA
jgi:hypothetical protein